MTNRIRGPIGWMSATRGRLLSCVAGSLLSPLDYLLALGPVGFICDTWGQPGSAMERLDRYFFPARILYWRGPQPVKDALLWYGRIWGWE